MSSVQRAKGKRARIMASVLRLQAVVSLRVNSVKTLALN
jgi:hypothetical protein